MAREANNSRAEGLEKRKGEIYLRGWHLGTMTGLSLNNRPLRPPDGRLEFSRKRSSGVHAREQVESVGSRVGVCMCSAHVRGQERGRMECGLLDIPLLSGLFWAGDWDILVMAKHRHCLHKV